MVKYYPKIKVVSCSISNSLFEMVNQSNSDSWKILRHWDKVAREKLPVWTIMEKPPWYLGKL